MFLKKTTLLLLFLLFASIPINAANFSKKASVKPLLIQKGDKKLWCSICGMNLKMFYKTSHTAHLKDSTPRQYCSIRCLAQDMKHHAVDSADIKVVDVATQEFITASKALYLVGSKIKGTMS